MLNMNANLYAAWTYGTAVAMETPIGIIKDANSALLKGVEPTTEGEGEEAISFVELGEAAMAVSPGEYFEADDAPLKDMSDQYVVAHLHNINHNGYIYFPYGTSDASVQILNNAVEMLIESKNEVTQAPAPGIVLEYKDHNTNISMTAAKSLVKPHIYYTTDGSEPTESSTEYTGVINTTEPLTVKAVVIAEGYLLSAVTTREVEIKEQPKTPTISMAYEEGKTTVTIDSGTDAEDIVVYYNTTGSTKVNASDIYKGSFTVTTPTDIYAFAVASESVWSEVAHQRAVVKNAHVAVDILSHFYTPANWIKQTDGETVLTNNGNIFAAGTNDNFTMWKEGTGRTETDPETGDEIVVYDEIDWVTSDEPLDEPQWMAMTKGQGVLWQNNDPKTDIIGDNEGIYPVSSLDIDTIFVATKNNLCFYKFAAGERPTGVIQSKNKFAGPFDIVMIDNMGSGNLMMEVSADGVNWIQVGDTIAKSGFSRMWQKDVATYEGTDEVFVRVSQPSVNTGTPKVYDIYVANAGEKSQELKAQFDQEWEAANTGIDTAQSQTTKAVKAVYNLNGIRQNGLQRGLNIVIMGDGTARKVVVK